MAPQVLSHSLCTVMKIPHDPVALEEHFNDDNKGPLSNQGYMPYLNRFILDRVGTLFNHVNTRLKDCGCILLTLYSTLMKRACSCTAA